LENQDRLTFLYQQFLAGNLTEPEMDELFLHFQTSDEKELHFLIRQELDTAEAETTATAEEEALLGRIHDHLKEHIHSGKQESTNIRRLLIYRIAAAASILLFLSIGTAYYFLHKQQPEQQIVQNKPIDFKPGSKKAILTLNNGQLK